MPLRACATCDQAFVSPTVGRRVYCDNCSNTGHGTCVVESCERPAGRSRGLCLGHYDRLTKKGDVLAHVPLGQMRRGRKTASPCVAEGCGRNASTGGHGYCAAHHRRLLINGDPLAHIPIGQMHGQRPFKNVGPCSIEGCDKPSKTRQLCTAHYSRYLNGTLDTDTSPVRPIRRAGEGHIDKNGYKIVSAKGHPNAWKTGHIMEHTLVMSQHLGRPLLANESVHHLNGDRADNRIENLELWVTQGGKHRKGQRVSDRVADAVQILERYAPELLAPHQVQLRVA